MNVVNVNTCSVVVGGYSAGPKSFLAVLFNPTYQFVDKMFKPVTCSVMQKVYL